MCCNDIISGHQPFALTLVENKILELFSRSCVCIPSSFTFGCARLSFHLLLTRILFLISSFVKCCVFAVGGDFVQHYKWTHGRREGGAGDLWTDLILEISSKRGCFLTFDGEKTNFTTFSPPRKILEKSPSSPLGKILPTPVNELFVCLFVFINCLFVCLFSCVFLVKRCTYFRELLILVLLQWKIKKIKKFTDLIDFVTFGGLITWTHICASPNQSKVMITEPSRVISRKLAASQGLMAVFNCVQYYTNLKLQNFQQHP